VNKLTILITGFLFLLYSYIKAFFISLLNSSKIDQMITGLSLGLLTLLIPVAMAILNDVYQKRTNENLVFSTLDLQVILNDVFKIKRLLYVITIIFISMFFWEVSKDIFLARLMELFASSVGIFFIGKTIFDVIRWLKGSVMEYRFDYLKSLNPSEDMINGWESLWSATKDNFEYYENEYNFFCIFASKIERLINIINNKNLFILIGILDDFNKNLKNRSLSFLMDRNVVAKIFELNFKAYGIRNNISIYSKATWGTIYLPPAVLSKLNDTIKYFERELLKQTSHDDYQLWYALAVFVQNLKDFIEKTKNDSSMSSKDVEEYCEMLSMTVFDELFSYMEVNNSADQVLKAIPEEWKITIPNLERKNNFYSLNLLKSFTSWIKKLVDQKNDKIELYKVINILFPGYNANLLTKAFKFVFTPYAKEKRILECVSEYEWNPKIIAKNEPAEKEINTFLLIKLLGEKYKLLEKLVNKDYLHRCLEEVKNRLYLLDDNLNDELNFYKYFCSKMLEYLEK